MKITNFNRLLLLVAFFGGCSLSTKISPERAIESERERLVRAYLEEGQEYENRGDLVGAYKQYKLAITVNPQSQLASENVKRLERELRKLAEEHYKAGLKSYRKGNYRLGRREFLMTLRLWPDHQKAVERLSIGKRIQAKRYVVHTIEEGESLSKLAMMYYGDHKKFSLIANYNKISDATVVRVGRKIKVPEIEGVPFLVKDQDTDVEEIGELTSDQSREEAMPKQEDEEEGSLEEPVDVVAMYLKHGIALYEGADYQDAIMEFNKVLNVNSDDVIAVDYLYKSYFQQAMISFAKRDYLSAKKGFEESLRYKSDCKKCDEYIRKSEEEYNEFHYAKGNLHFRNERLEDALKEWEMVYAVDPGYKGVEQNISKATKLLETLEEIQKSRQDQMAR